MGYVAVSNEIANKKWGGRIRPIVICFTVKFRAGASATPI